MTRDDAIRMLPCYVCGDLPEPELEAVERCLTGDPALRQLVSELRSEQRRVMQEMCGSGELPPELRALLSTEPPVAAATPAPPMPANFGISRWWLVVGALVGAAALILGMNLWGPTESAPALAAFARGHDLAASEPARLDPLDHAALEAAFEAAGVPPELRMVSDYAGFGLHAEAVYILPGAPPGTATVYSDGEQRYVCQMWVQWSPPAGPTHALRIRGVEVRAYRVGALALVVWQEAGMVCVLSAEVPVEQLIALMERKLSQAG